MKNVAPIGIFDSGVGGLSVLDQISLLLPSENLVYVADSKFAPYGPLSAEHVRSRAFKIMDFLIANHDIKLMVVACNTATAACIMEMREEYSIPIVGMEPAVKPAITSSKEKQIGILATEGTLKSAKFSALLEHYDGEYNFYTQPCIGLVELIEKGEINTPQIRELVYKYLAPLKHHNVDVIVLGCTHYFYIKNIVEEYFKKPVKVIDTGRAVAQQAYNMLKKNNLLNTGGDKSPLIYSNSSSNINELVKKLIPNNNNKFLFSDNFKI
tara:strand:- start:1437 stop:2240 length:804 start_codon:yes stop_codon:yes gene_type:complete